jgi:benzoate/toluate 1,2-dioxygenase beta subunit
MMDEREAERFLYREARLMDEHQYDEWLSLWAQDCLYWVPCRHEQEESDYSVSVIYDRRTRLEDRIARLKSGEVLAQDPPPRMRRLLSNIEVTASTADEVTVDSNFMLIQARNSEQILWCGRSIHTLRRENSLLKISKKKVLLVNSEQELPPLQFLI